MTLSEYCELNPAMDEDYWEEARVDFLDYLEGGGITAEEYEEKHDMTIDKFRETFDRLDLDIDPLPYGWDM